MTTQVNRSIDPRIDSPEIRIVYPSAVDLSKEPETTGGIKAPQPQVLPQSSVTVNALPPAPSTPPTAQEITVIPTTKKWTDILTENATLFIAVVLISLLTGILIGKKL